MTDKQFESYLTVKFAELENQHLSKDLPPTEEKEVIPSEERAQAREVIPSKTLAAVLNKLVEEAQKLYDEKEQVNPSQNEQENPPHLHNYQQRILKKWILETVIQQLHPGEDVATSPFYHKVAHKLSNVCAKTDSTPAAIEEALKKLNLLPQKDPSANEITVENNENTPPWHETIKTLEKKAFP